MTPHEVIAVLCGCIAALGFALVGLDRMNDQLRKENARLRRENKKIREEKHEKTAENPVGCVDGMEDPTEVPEDPPGAAAGPRDHPEKGVRA